VYAAFPGASCGISGMPRHVHSCAFVGGGFSVQKYDIRLDARDDILDKAGFMRALELILRVRKFGFVMLAPPCSWFVFLSSPMHRPR
jgi:hypothetical protein